MTAFLLAIQFLTRLPVPDNLTVNNQQLRLSVLYYPLVGVLIGAFLVLFAMLSAQVSLPVQAVLVLTIWIMITGGLHLDGLADCADAWAGGFNNPQRALEIMKDPAAGPIAVISLILVLLLKWTALTELLEKSQLIGLIIAPMLGRTAILVLMLSTPYLRAQGLGTVLNENLAKGKITLLVFGSALLSFYFVGFLPLLFVALTVSGIRKLALQRLDGVTGDVYGAAVELVETSVLVGLVIQ